MSIGSRQPRAGRSLAAAFSLAFLFMVGCGSGGGPRGGSQVPPPGSSNAYATLAWQIYGVSGDGPLTCDEVAGYSFSVSFIDSYGNYYDAATVGCAPNDTFFQANTAYVPAGLYAIEFYLYGNPSVYGTSDTVIGSYRVDGIQMYAGANNFAGSPQAVYVESFVVGWALYNGSRLSACNPGELVELQFRASGGVWIISQFACEQYAGTSFPIPVNYTSAEWNIYLLGSSGQELDAIAGGVVAIPEGINVNLGTHSFYVNH